MHCAHVNEFIQCFAHGCFKCSLCLANPEGECHIEYNDLISIWKFNMKARCHDWNRYYKITHYNKHRLAQHPIPQIGNYKFNMILYDIEQFTGAPVIIIQQPVIEPNNIPNVIQPQLGNFLYLLII